MPGSTLTPAALVTVAYLKARLDLGEDQLGIFMPLVLDVLRELPNRHFTTSEVQTALHAKYKLAMPLTTIGSLLRRCCRQGYLVRAAGMYTLADSTPLPLLNVKGEMEQLERALQRLGEALIRHAAVRHLQVTSIDEAATLLLQFLEVQQIALLLDAAPREQEALHLSRSVSVVVAEFLHDVVRKDPAMASTLSSILAGLVIYQAAFLPDLTDLDRHFKNLTVAFDSVLVRQALGYEGTAPREMVREIIDLLRSSGVQCIVFDKTVQEIQRILAMYQQRLATSEGRRGLRQVPMARHFLTQRYSPSDVQEMSALLEKDILAVGLRIELTPERQSTFTLSEGKLAARLADPGTRDTDQPRVQHDVDCAAAILTLRKNHRAWRIEEARAVFVTVSTLVIQNTKLWWNDDENESGVPPIVHVRSLANLAWLKKPRVTEGIQLKALIALCAAAMRPSTRVWNKFLGHLDALQQSERLSPDDATAVIVSSMSDELLREAEIEVEDPDDIDAVTLDEVVARVMATYEAKAVQEIAESQAASIRELGEARRLLSETHATAEARLFAVKKETENLGEALRRRDLSVDRRSRRYARAIVVSVYWPVILVVLGLGILLIYKDIGSNRGFGMVFGVAIILFTVFEIFGIVQHVERLRDYLEIRLTRRVRAWLAGEGEG